MKAIKSDATLALELHEIILERRSLDKRETELKGYFKTRLANLGINTVTIAGVLISLVDRERRDLDRKAIEAQFGPDLVKQFEKVTRFTQVDVKQLNEQMLKKAA